MYFSVRTQIRPNTVMGIYVQIFWTYMQIKSHDYGTCSNIIYMKQILFINGHSCLKSQVFKVRDSISRSSYVCHLERKLNIRKLCKQIEVCIQISKLYVVMISIC